MPIHVARNAAQLGIFSVAEIADGLQTGRFHLTDLAWTEGMATWVPLINWPVFQHLTTASVAAQPVPAAGLVLPAWERQRSGGNYFRTFYDVIGNPGHTFNHLPAQGVGRSLSFYYLTIGVAWLLMSLVVALLGWLVYLKSVTEEVLPHGLVMKTSMSVLTAITPFAVIIGVMLFVVLVGPFVIAGLAHLCLLPWRPSGGYAATQRASSYVVAALAPLFFVPCLNYFWVPACLAFMVLACAQVHRLAWWKALLSLVVLPAAILIPTCVVAWVFWG